MNRRPLLLATLAALALAAGPARAQGLPELPAAKLVPVVQVLPLPDDQASFTVGGREVARYWFAPRQERPFVYPIIGASGRSLTRMGHPRDPVGHGHHNSFWVAHQSVDGENYWEDPGAPKIVPRKILRYDDGDAEAAITSDNDWVGADGRVHMTDRRRMTVRPMKDGEWLLTLDLQFRAPDTPVNPGGSVVLGDTAFGPVAVRMAKTIGVADGGGRLRNSEGNEDEQGPNGCFRKPARWVDYSGPIVEGVAEGITLLDHPANPSHPSPFHVRRDGWMGAALTFGGARTIEPGKPLLLRYALYVHRGVPAPQVIEAVWKEFARDQPQPLPAK